MFVNWVVQGELTCRPLALFCKASLLELNDSILCNIEDISCTYCRALGFKGCCLEVFMLVLLDSSLNASLSFFTSYCYLDVEF